MTPHEKRNSTGDPTPEKEAEALYDYLSGLLPANDPSVPGEEAALAENLKQLARQMQADPEFASSLEDQLLANLGPEALPDSPRPAPASPSPARQFSARSWRTALFSSGRTLLWAGVALALVLGFGWSMRNLLPQPPAAATVQVNETESNTERQPLVATAATNQEALPEEAAANEYTSNYLPGISLILNANFPTAPGEVNLYTPAENPTALTPASAQEAAAQLGIQGQVYVQEGEAGRVSNYIVTDGASRVTYFGSLDRFYYVADYAEILQISATALPLDERAAAAEAFLKERGLLDFAYQVEQSPYSADVVRFIPLQDDLSIRYPSFQAPQIDVQVGLEGQVRSLMYTRFRLQEQGRFPVISAEEAWQKVTSAQGGAGVEVYSLDQTPSLVQNWVRPYPEGELVDLYGYPEILQPAEAGQPPFVSFNNLTVVGNLEAFTSQAQISTFMHVWGKVERAADGHQVFRLEGWETSPLQDQFITGVIEREGERAYLRQQKAPKQQNMPPQSDEDANRRLLLPDLPADAPTGQSVLARGVVLNSPEPTLDWSFIQTGPGGGGGGGGGGNFLEVNLEGGAGASSLEPTATPIPASSANQPGFQPGAGESSGESSLEITATPVPASSALQPGAGESSGASSLEITATPVPASSALQPGFQPGAGESSGESSLEITATPFPPPDALQPGDAVDALEGSLQVNLYEQTDGSLRKEIMLFVIPNAAYPQILFAYLEPGDNPASLEGIEALHGLKVRIKGEIIETNQEFSRIAVDRYEEVLPGVRIQAFLGTYELTTVEGEQVVLFTTQEGEQYILSSSIGSDYDGSAGRPGDTIIIEGYIDKQRQFGGYPVLEERAAQTADGVTDLSNYEITSDEPPIIPEKAAQPGGKVIIDRIELAYYTYGLVPGAPEQGILPGYLQPVWRFLGQYESGIRLEIFVQALPDHYLKR